VGGWLAGVGLRDYVISGVLLTFEVVSLMGGEVRHEKVILSLL